jgi:hypothetical protein
VGPMHAAVEGSRPARRALIGVFSGLLGKGRPMPPGHGRQAR